MFVPALLLFAGCAAEMELDSSEEDTASVSEDLRRYDNGIPSNDPNAPWRDWTRLLPTNNVDIDHEYSPAHCGTPAGFLTVTTDDVTGKYNVLQWSGRGKGPAWSAHGTRIFHGKPACTLREPAPDGRTGYVLAGKGTDGRTYASPGIMAPATLPYGSPAPVPGAPGEWAAVSSQVYFEGGDPALATGGFGAGDSVVMAFMGDDNRTIYAHTRRLPYLSNSWSARITGPMLPAGWEVAGSPGIAKMAVTFMIAVRAWNTNTHARALFVTHFFANGAIAHFSNNIGSPPATWTQQSVTGHYIVSSPALTFSNTFGPTVYFRSIPPPGGASSIRQTTGNPLGQNPVLEVEPDDGLLFVGDAAASADWQLTVGRHVVVARTSADQLYYIESERDALLGP
jgi:hypothetical protein